MNWKIKSERLWDQTIVWDLVISHKDEGRCITFHCRDYESAQALVEALRATTIDFED
jgi:hypothetical protein